MGEILNEIEDVIAASPRITVLFNKLVLSHDYQARPSGGTSKLSIAELAASIKASGVLQNLVVIKGQRGMLEVCASGRRLATMNSSIAASCARRGEDRANRKPLTSKRWPRSCPHCMSRPDQ